MANYYKVTRTEKQETDIKLSKEEAWVLSVLDGCPFCHSKKNREMLIKESDNGSCKVVVRCYDCNMFEVIC